MNNFFVSLPAVLLVDVLRFADVESAHNLHQFVNSDTKLSLDCIINQMDDYKVSLLQEKPLSKLELKWLLKNRCNFAILNGGMSCCENVLRTVSNARNEHGGLSYEPLMADVRNLTTVQVGSGLLTDHLLTTIIDLCCNLREVKFTSNSSDQKLVSDAAIFYLSEITGSQLTLVHLSVS